MERACPQLLAKGPDFVCQGWVVGLDRPFAKAADFSRGSSDPAQAFADRCPDVRVVGQIVMRRDRGDIEDRAGLVRRPFRQRGAAVG